MDDDFNTPEAVALLFELANDVNRDNSREAAVLLKSLAGILGLLQRKPEEFLQGGSEVVGVGDELRISSLIAAREDARKVRNFSESDRIRKELEDAGIVLEDKPGGKTEWRRK
jgi:cysteinyl-tRNA synthetase